jgi:hypothetical protein
MIRFNNTKKELYNELVSMFPYERDQDVISLVKTIPTNYTPFSRNKINALDYIVQIALLKQNESLPEPKTLKDLTLMIEFSLKSRKSNTSFLKDLVDYSFSNIWISRV